MTNEPRKTRNILPLSDFDRENDMDDRQMLFADIRKLERSGNSVFSNQKNAAAALIECFQNAITIFAMVIALCQSGKTGIIFEFIKRYLSDPSNHTPVNNIYIITGLSSLEWGEQMKRRFPFNIKVFTRDYLNNAFIEELKYKRDVLIIIDEVHIACTIKNTIRKVFSKVGWMSNGASENSNNANTDFISTLLERDIKIVQVSATPDAALYSLTDPNWGDHSTILLADPGDNYIGTFQLEEQGRVFQYQNLWLHNSITGQINKASLKYMEEYKNAVDSFKEPRYNLLRIPGSKTTHPNIAYLKNILPETEYNYIDYDQGSDIKDINTILSVKPLRSTIILVKERLRCSYTLEKKYLGVLYERKSSSQCNDSCQIQGFLGRGCGYSQDTDFIIFTNLDTIKRYKAIWRDRFGQNTLSIRWNSTTTKFSRIHNSTVTKADTFNTISWYRPIPDESTIQAPRTKYRKHVYKGIDGANGMLEMRANFKDYFIDPLPPNVKMSIPNKRKKSENSIPPNRYEAKIKKEQKVWTEEEIKHYTTYIGAANNLYWLYPCYEDIHDESTLKWYLISKYLKPELSEPI